MNVSSNELNLNPLCPYDCILLLVSYSSPLFIIGGYPLLKRDIFLTSLTSLVSLGLVFSHSISVRNFHRAIIIKAVVTFVVGFSVIYFVMQELRLKEVMIEDFANITNGKYKNIDGIKVHYLQQKGQENSKYSIQLIHGK